MIREIDLNTLYKRAQKKMETNVSECPIKMPSENDCHNGNSN